MIIVEHVQKNIAFFPFLSNGVSGIKRRINDFDEFLDWILAWSLQKVTEIPESRNQDAHIHTEHLIRPVLDHWKTDLPMSTFRYWNFPVIYACVELLDVLCALLHIYIFSFHPLHCAVSCPLIRTPCAFSSNHTCHRYVLFLTSRTITTFQKQ